MPKTYCLEVTGDYACFTRPEMKVERVSYDIITPSATRAIFESILWKPAIRWIPTKIEILHPIRWASVRRNEVGSKIPTSKVKSAMKNGNGALALYVEEDRQQRASLLLRDVKYRLHAHFEMTQREHKPNFPHLVNVVSDKEEPSNYQENTPAKFLNMFERRAKKGQCINQPYLGCREFACDFRLIENQDDKPELIDETRDLGWMLYDMDFSNKESPMPRFFNVRMENGVVTIPPWSSEEVKG